MKLWSVNYILYVIKWCDYCYDTHPNKDYKYKKFFTGFPELSESVSGESGVTLQYCIIKWIIVSHFVLFVCDIDWLDIYEFYRLENIKTFK